jgi:hypothetical protein
MHSTYRVIAFMLFASLFLSVLFSPCIHAMKRSTEMMEETPFSALLAAAQEFKDSLDEEIEPLYSYNKRKTAIMEKTAIEIPDLNLTVYSPDMKNILYVRLGNLGIASLPTKNGDHHLLFVYNLQTLKVYLTQILDFIPEQILISENDNIRRAISEPTSDGLLLGPWDIVLQNGNNILISPMYSRLIEPSGPDSLTLPVESVESRYEVSFRHNSQTLIKNVPFPREIFCSASDHYLWVDEWASIYKWTITPDRNFVPYQMLLTHKTTDHAANIPADVVYVNGHAINESKYLAAYVSPSSGRVYLCLFNEIPTSGEDDTEARLTWAHTHTLAIGNMHVLIDPDEIRFKSYFSGTGVYRLFMYLPNMSFNANAFPDVEDSEFLPTYFLVDVSRKLAICELDSRLTHNEALEDYSSVEGPVNNEMDKLIYDPRSDCLLFFTEPHMVYWYELPPMNDVSPTCALPAKLEIQGIAPLNEDQVPPVFWYNPWDGSFLVPSKVPLHCSSDLSIVAQLLEHLFAHKPFNHDEKDGTASLSLQENDAASGEKQNSGDEPAKTNNNQDGSFGTESADDVSENAIFLRDSLPGILDSRLPMANAIPPATPATPSATEAVQTTENNQNNEQNKSVAPSLPPVFQSSRLLSHPLSTYARRVMALKNIPFGDHENDLFVLDLLSKGKTFWDVLIYRYFQATHQ